MQSDLPTLTRSVFVQVFAWASIVISAVHAVASLGLQQPVDDLVIPHDGALMGALAGVILLAHLADRPRLRRWLSFFLLLLTLLCINRVTNPELALHSWLRDSMGFRQQLPELLALALFALAFLVFVSLPRAALLLRGAGIVLVVSGTALVVALWLTDLSLVYGTAISGAMVGAAWIIMAGVSLWLLSMPVTERDDTVSSRALGAGLLFMMLSVSAWYMLSLQHQRQLTADALDALQTAGPAIAMTTHDKARLLRRISTRWSSIGGDPASLTRRLETQGYFGHFPGLTSLALVDNDGELIWLQSPDGADQYWRGVLQREENRTWMSEASHFTALRIPEFYPADAGPLLLISTPAILDNRSPGRVTGIFRLDSLLQHGVQFDPTPFSIQLRSGDTVLHEIPTGSEDTVYRRVSSERLRLSTDIQLELVGYHTDTRALLRTPTFYILAALLGNLFAVALAIAIESAQRSARHTQELNRLLRRADSVSHIQGMVAQGLPLPLTLQTLCELLEQELSDIQALVMRMHQGSDRLHLAAHTGLAPEVQTTLQQVPVDAAAGGCAKAAAEARNVMITDLLEQAELAPSLCLHTNGDFRACWSLPAISGRGEVLGVLVLYCRHPGEPDQQQQSLIEEMLSLISLALEVDADRAALQHSEQRYASLFSEHPDAVFSLDEKARFVSVNRAIEDLLGRPRDSFIGQTSNTVLIPQDRQVAALHFQQAMAGEASRYEVRSRHAQGHLVYLDLTNLPIVVNGEVTGVFGIAKDVSAQRRQEAELAFSASHDALTGLPNRSLLQDRLSLSCQQASRHDEYLAVLFIDLDGFKPVNDSLGHAVGDELLIEVGQRLSDLLRPGDTLARFGGDEFVAILTDLPAAASATPTVEAMLDALARPYLVAGAEITLTASIGITVSIGAVSDPMTLVQQADMAMYRAKQMGRNHYQWYSQEINVSVSNRVALRNELQEAIDQNHFELHYQPILQADSRCLRTLEALLRWKHPTQGYRPPAEFIPLAEETGQIIPLSQWVLQQACLDLQQLRQQGDLSVSVNLSFMQFRRANFLDSVLGVLDEAGLPRHAMTLELTESILMEDKDKAVEVLQALRDAGVRVAIDDFGTGFSSLSYLRNLPVNELKIDRSFINEVVDNPHDAAITRSIINMAQQLQLEVIGEGVETAAQAEWLTAQGCDGLQGFYFARPAPLRDLADLLHSLQNYSASG